MVIPTAENTSNTIKHLKKSDERSRWWPDWYEYTICNETREMIYGQRTLIRPSTTPDSSKYVLWSTAINLVDVNTFIHGPFDFADVCQGNRTKNTVHQKDWQVLYEFCCKHSLLPPAMGTQIHSSPNINRRKRKQPGRG